MKKNLPAFSLIEVVIALGLFAFCIIGIVGLLPIAANSTKSVFQESNANNIAESIAGIWQVAPTTNISITNSNFPMTNLYIGSSNLSTSNYFNEFGQQTDSNSASLRMEYVATSLPAPNTNSFAVNMTFYWPAHSTNTNTTTKRTFNYIFTK